MVTKFKYSATKSTKAKVRNVVVLSMNEKMISGIDLTKLTKEEAKACKKLVRTPAAKRVENDLTPYMKAYRKFDLSKVIR